MNKSSNSNSSSRNTACEESGRNSRNNNVKREQTICEVPSVPPVCEAGRGTVLESGCTTVNVPSSYQGHTHVENRGGSATTASANSSYHHNGGAGSSRENNGIAVSSSYHHSGSNGSNTSGGGVNDSSNIPTSYHQAEVANGGPSVGEGAGGGGVPANVSSSYHLSQGGGGGVVAGNGGPGGQVNTAPSYYYSPILNSQQSLLRPIMTAQPPLYSPLLASQQHSYPVPHASPSAGTAYFANLSETMRSGLTEMLPGSSENVYKDVGQSSRQGSSTEHAGKACDASDSRQYAMEVCQRRLQQDGGYNSVAYPSCGEVTTRPGHVHDQRTFDDYSRMGVYSEDGTGRTWDGMGGCGTVTSTSRTTVPPNHVSHPYTYSYTDCRLDAAWNKCVAGVSVGAVSGVNGESFASQEQQVDSPQVKPAPRGASGHTLTVNMNMGMGSADPSMSRCHYEYQAIPGTQIPPFLPYFAPLGYQQVTDARLETRSDHRSSSHRSDQPTASLPHTLTTSQANVSTHTNSETTAHQECLAHTKNTALDLIQECSQCVYKKKSSEEVINECQPCVVCDSGSTMTVTQQGVAEVAASSLPCTTDALALTKNGMSSSYKKKRLVEEASMNSDSAVCLICDAAVSGSGHHDTTNTHSTLAASSMDSLITVMSKFDEIYCFLYPQFYKKQYLVQD